MSEQYYEGWTIEKSDFDGYWIFSHEDHDGENGLCGLGDSIEDCHDQISMIVEAEWV